jgi:amidase
VTDLPFDDPLGAFCRDNHAALEHTSDGPLDGLSFGVKDVFHIAGHRTGFGNPDWLATHPAEDRTATAVTATLAAGADMLGRTISDELTYSLTGENAHYGTPVNTAALDRVPGGSSSGSAAAVAGGLVDFALGTDCGGSVRLPASYCGILGIRPTHGLVSVDGVIPFAPSFDCVGWFARDADCLARVGHVLFGQSKIAQPPRRVMIAEDAFELVGTEVASALADGAATVAQQVGEQAAVRVAPEGLRAWFEIFRIIQGYEIWSNRRDWIEAVSPTFGRGIRERLDWASTVTSGDAAAARAMAKGIGERLDALLGDGEILCLPTSPRVAPRKDEPTDKIEIEFREQAMCLLCIAGLGGLPQINLPLGSFAGLPLGLSLIGPRGSDSQLLTLASTLSAAAQNEAHHS